MYSSVSDEIAQPLDGGEFEVEGSIPESVNPLPRSENNGNRQSLEKGLKLDGFGLYLDNSEWSGSCLHSYELDVESRVHL